MCSCIIIGQTVWLERFGLLFLIYFFTFFTFFKLKSWATTWRGGQILTAYFGLSTSCEWPDILVLLDQVLKKEQQQKSMVWKCLWLDRQWGLAEPSSPSGLTFWHPTVFLLSHTQIWADNRVSGWTFPLWINVLTSHSAFTQSCPVFYF